MIGMLLVANCSGIRSERHLCEEVHLNLAYRWLCRLDPSDLLRHIFEATAARWMEEGLVGGQEFAIDASLISANVQK